MVREKNFGRGKYRPPAPDPGAESTRLEYVNEVHSPVELAVKQFEQFARDWIGPAVTGSLFQYALDGMRARIRAIAPAADVRQIVGWAVFRYELDADYAMAHVPVSPVFDKLKWAENSRDGFANRKPGEYVICEIRSLP